MTILGAGKYDYLISHSKNLKSKNLYFLILLRFLYILVELSKEFGQILFKIHCVVAEIIDTITIL
jgi:hypothetical protein